MVEGAQSRVVSVERAKVKDQTTCDAHFESDLGLLSLFGRLGCCGDGDSDGGDGSQNVRRMVKSRMLSLGPVDFLAFDIFKNVLCVLMYERLQGLMVVASRVKKEEM